MWPPLVVEVHPPADSGATLESAAATRVLELLAGDEGPFSPIPELDPRRPSTSFRIRGRELRVDFLTPLRGRERVESVVLLKLGLAATPLRFLDYLITKAMPQPSSKPCSRTAREISTGRWRRSAAIPGWPPSYAQKHTDWATKSPRS